ncbi:hypothetical protein KTC70_27930 [Klebsiella pneumoniae]|nr:hypothetical protein [Klebsiella pneumoniae]
MGPLLITNGGTGIARRDVTYEALFATIQQEIPGFGEISGCSVTKKLVVAPWCLVHSLAFQKAAYCFLRCLDQVNACQLAVQKLIIPELPHLIAERQK